MYIGVCARLHVIIFYVKCVAFIVFIDVFILNSLSQTKQKKIYKERKTEKWMKLVYGYIPAPVSFCR